MRVRKELRVCAHLDVKMSSVLYELNERWISLFETVEMTKPSTSALFVVVATPSVAVQHIRDPSVADRLVNIRQPLFQGTQKHRC